MTFGFEVGEKTRSRSIGCWLTGGGSLTGGCPLTKIFCTSEASCPLTFVRIKDTAHKTIKINPLETIGSKYLFSFGIFNF